MIQMEKKNIDVNMPVKPTTDYLSGKDYEFIRDLIREMSVQLSYMKNRLNKFLRTNYNLNSDSISDSLFIKKDDIPNMSDDDLRRFLVNHQLKDGVYNESCREELESAMSIVKDAFITLASSEKEFNSIQNEANEITRDYYEFLNSVKMEEIREKRINDMKELNKSIEDDVEKKKNSEKIDFMEKVYNMSFLLERLNDLGNDEVERLMKIYFDAKIGSYMIKKYEDRIKRLGFSEKIYTNFFNIEENFLPEEYHVFNNMFLCIYMDWLSHQDVDQVKYAAYAKSMTGNIANLIYHEFASTEKEQKFIDFIKEVLDKFESRRDYFLENNASYKNNPRRIEAERIADENARAVYKKKFKELGMPEKYSDDEPIDKLKEIYASEVNELIESQIRSSETNDESDTLTEKEVSDEKEVINDIKNNIKDGLDTIVRKEKEESEKRHEEVTE